MIESLRKAKPRNKEEHNELGTNEKGVFTPSSLKCDVEKGERSTVNGRKEGWKRIGEET
jgi:hypothetical protein